MTLIQWVVLTHLWHAVDTPVVVVVWCLREPTDTSVTLSDCDSVGSASSGSCHNVHGCSQLFNSRAGIDHVSCSPYSVMSTFHRATCTPPKEHFIITQ